MNRRSYIKKVTSFIAAGEFLENGFDRSSTEAAERASDFNIYFGDLHSHNEVGYGLGSIERAFDIASSHLDFTAITPHAYMDTSYDPAKGLEGMEDYSRIVAKRWNDVLELNRKYYKPGKFVTFPAYERHSRDTGHMNIIFQGVEPPLEFFRELEDFKKYARKYGAILIPHHPGYPGGRGSVPETWEQDLTMLLEMYSEHGNAECDTAPIDYVRHSGVGRVTAGTYQSIISSGYRLGAIASTDNHLGFPGAYGEGKTAILAKKLTREALFEALKKRRVYGLTGDRISLDFSLNGRIMGSDIPYARTRNISVTASGWDWINRIEVLKNNRVIHREFPIDKTSTNFWKEPLLLRIEYGWGPMAANQRPIDYIPPVFDWDIKAGLENGKIEALQTCFQAAPLDEERRHRLVSSTGSGIHLQSYTSRLRCLNQCDTNAVVLKVNCSPYTVISLDLRSQAAEQGKSMDPQWFYPNNNPADQVSEKIRFSDLIRGDRIITARNTSLKLHRLVPAINYKSSFAISDVGSGNRTDWYYVRVIQTNGQLAWSSPVWVERR